MNRDRVRQGVNVVAVIATLVVNGLANALPLNGQSTGEISDRFAIYFVPAGYVFSIWGLIYLGLIAFAVYQALPAQAQNPRLRRIGPWFALSCAANIAWIFFWHYEQFPPTLAAMLALLAALLVIYLRLEIGRRPAAAIERWVVNLPFSLYLGWISVATIANVTQVLYYLGWGGWGIAPQVWAAVMLTAAVIIGAAMSLIRRDVAYAAVLVWAFIGIAIKHAAAPTVAYSAWIATVLIAAAVVLGQVRRTA